MGFGSPSVSEIVKGQLYIGNLSAALSAEQREKIGVTHIVSVCPDYPSTGEHHLNIPVDDTEYDDLLIHLPKACRFIHAALDKRGKVLVHCVMGISRSTTVLAAYLMKIRNMDASSAITFIRKRRPQVHPNYGFVKQLNAFAKCQYEPFPHNMAYRSWKRQQAKDIKKFLNHISDIAEVVHNKVLLSSDFPEDPEQAESLLRDLGITHVLSLSPAEIPSAVASMNISKHHHINLSNQDKESLVISLPDACQFIRRAVDSGGLVLIHSLIESRACVVACAYLMCSKHILPDEAYSILIDALPLFTPNRNFSRQLELFESCGRNPTPDHPLVRHWLDTDSPTKKPYNSRSLSKTLNTQDSSCKPYPSELSKTAANILSETGYDLKAFGEALTAIQKHSGSNPPLCPAISIS